MSNSPAAKGLTSRWSETKRPRETSGPASVAATELELWLRIQGRRESGSDSGSEEQVAMTAVPQFPHLLHGIIAPILEGITVRTG